MRMRCNSDADARHEKEDQVLPDALSESARFIFRSCMCKSSLGLRPPAPLRMANGGVRMKKMLGIPKMLFRGQRSKPALENDRGERICLTRESMNGALLKIFSDVTGFGQHTAILSHVCPERKVRFSQAPKKKSWRGSSPPPGSLISSDAS